MEAAAGRVLNRLRAELKEHDTALRSLYGDGWSAPALKQREFQVLTAASLLGEEATGLHVAQTIESWGVRILLGTVYLTVEGLEDLGLVRSIRLGTVKEDGWPKYCYRLTELGESALVRARAEGMPLLDPRQDPIVGPCTERIR